MISNMDKLNTYTLNLLNRYFTRELNDRMWLRVLSLNWYEYPFDKPEQINDFVLWIEVWVNIHRM